MNTTCHRRLITPLLLAMTISLGWSHLSQAQQPFDSDPLQLEPDKKQDLVPVEPEVQIRPRVDRQESQPFSAPQDRDAAGSQQIMLNTKFAGWEGAKPIAERGTNQLGDMLRGSWIMVDVNGRFDGIVTPGEGADIGNMNIFLMHMGRLVNQTTVDSSGRFSFNNVNQGAYGLVGWGANGFFAFGLNILANNPENEGKISNQVSATAFQNKTTINTDWIRDFAPKVGFRVFGVYPNGEGRDDPTSLYGLLGLYNNLPPFVPSTSISSHNVSRTSDGRLLGRVHQINSLNGRPVNVRSTKVLLLENDSVVASTETDNFGIFEFQNVPNGSFGVLAAGLDGVGLISINVADTPNINADGEAFQVSTAEMIDFTLVSAETIGFLNHYANEVAYKRGLLAPRPPEPIDPANQFGCQQCNDQAGGCSHCQQQYLQSLCRSRGLTFEQWQANGCQCVKSGFGDGRFLREAGQNLRQRIEKVDQFYEGVFYPDGGGQQYQNYQPQPVFPVGR